VRQSIAAGVNITYKILQRRRRDDRGQPVDGTPKVPEMTRELDAEGVKKTSSSPTNRRTTTRRSDARLADGVRCAIATI
jgi:indolepyruvate ferredoxin oxidoreductase